MIEKNRVAKNHAKKHVFDYIEVYYNRKRLHSTLGFLSPESFKVTMVA
jgi:putative transposase